MCPQAGAICESPVAPHPRQNLMLSVIFILAILMGMQTYLTMVLFIKALLRYN